MNKTPIYQHSGLYAQENNELEKYFASHNANLACKDAIEQAIADHYHNSRLSNAAAKKVIAEFGIDRTMYVLAATIQAKDSDGRIDRNNKAWAQAFPLVVDLDTFGRDRTRELELYRAHPGLINLFAHAVRDEATISCPLYQGTFEQAQDAGELTEYRTSRRVNALCAREIDEAVTAGWDGMHVAPEAVKQVLERFGPERVSYVLANTIQQSDGDGRFSGINRSWAETVPMFVPLEERYYCTVENHPTKLDDFITVAREEMAQMDKQREKPAKAKRPSVRKKLQEKSDAPAAPKPSAKRKVKDQER